MTSTPVATLATNAWALSLPIALQGSLLAWDEIVFHRRRGLPRWERIGHPLDALTILACLAVARLAPYTPTAQLAYAALALFSCLFVTKDEFVHADACSPIEHWLHAVQFLVHPIVLGAAYLLWRARTHELGGAPSSADALTLQIAATALAALTQSLYWNMRHDTAA